jgi:lysophospholipase L1-like esterase
MRVVVRVIVFLFCLEVFLRLGGAVSLFWQDHLNRQAMGQSEYRILCVGDSMTYGDGAGDYPACLEELFRSHYPALTVRVLNKGLPGGEVSGLADKLPGWMKEYRPDMVLVMIGLLDQPVPDALLTPAQRWDKRLGFANVYKLGKALVKDAQEHFWPVSRQAVSTVTDKPSGDSVNTDMQEIFARYFLAASIAQQAGKYDDAARIFAELERAPVDDVRTDQARRRLVPLLRVLGRYQELSDIISRNISLTWVGDVVEDMCRRREALDVLGPALKARAQGSQSPVPYDVYGACLSLQGEQALAEEYLAKSRLIRKNGSYIGMSRTLSRVWDEIVSGGGIMVLVQYPLRDPAIYRNALHEAGRTQDVVIVDNRSTFRRALAEGAYDDYFKDRIGGDFGHCTPRGNQILAENILREILPVVKSRAAR